MLNRFDQQLEFRKENYLLRVRDAIEPINSIKVRYKEKEYISFCSNDYLGLANHIKVIEALKKGAEQFGVGSGASQFVSGHRTIHQELECEFAEFLNQEKALLFSNGYMANLGTVSALARECEKIYVDKNSHASLIDGVILSQISYKRYRHNDLQQLEKWIENSANEQSLIVTDSVFSMQGDLAKLTELAQISQKANALLLVDDAHGIGVLGKNGRGALEHFDLKAKDISVLISPLGKAFGCFGAIVAGSSSIIDFLMQNARTYIYTTAMPPALACAAKESLSLVKKEPWRRQKLFDLIKIFKNKIKQTPLLLLVSDTPIQSLLIKDSYTAQNLCNRLLEKGFLVKAMRPPSVPKNLICLRITLSCLHHESHIDDLINALMDCYETL